MGVREGKPIGRFAYWRRSYGGVAGFMGAKCVQGERTHRAQPADAKKAI